MSNTLYIYDVIGRVSLFEWGVTAEGVLTEMAKMDRKQPITARINSTGGSVFEGVTIRSLLRDWKSGVHVIVDGIAASAASFIATAGDTVAMAEGAMLMIHDPWTYAEGNAANFQKAADDLNAIADSMATAYARKSGKSAEEIRDLMLAETWMSADQAIAYGLANSKTEDPVMAFIIPKEFNYRNAPPNTPVESPKHRAVNELAAMRRRLDLM